MEIVNDCRHRFQLQWLLEKEAKLSDFLGRLPHQRPRNGRRRFVNAAVTGPPSLQWSSSGRLTSSLTRLWRGGAVCWRPIGRIDSTIVFLCLIFTSRRDCFLCCTCSFSGFRLTEFRRLGFVFSAGSFFQLVWSSLGYFMRVSGFIPFYQVERFCLESGNGIPFLLSKLTQHGLSYFTFSNLPSFRIQV